MGVMGAGRRKRRISGFCSRCRCRCSCAAGLGLDLGLLLCLLLLAAVLSVSVSMISMIFVTIMEYPSAAILLYYSSLLLLTYSYHLPILYTHIIYHIIYSSAFPYNLNHKIYNWWHQNQPRNHNPLNQLPQFKAIVRRS